MKLAPIWLASSLAVCESVVAAPPHSRTVTILDITLDPKTPAMNFVAVVPLNQGPDATLEICKALIGMLPTDATAKYSCRNGTVDEISTAPLPGLPGTAEKGVVAVLHITEASGRRNDVDAFELLNVGAVAPRGLTMQLCQNLATAAGNKTAKDDSGHVTHSDVHYTCEVDNNP